MTASAVYPDSGPQKIKCDETLQYCSQCTRKWYECPGYKRPLKWSSKNEVATGNETRERRVRRRRDDISGAPTDGTRMAHEGLSPGNRPGTEEVHVPNDQTAPEAEHNSITNFQLPDGVLSSYVVPVHPMPSNPGLDTFGTGSSENIELLQ